MPEFHYDGQPATSRPSKLPLINLAARVATLASLIVSMIIIKVNTVTLDNGATLTYDNFFLTYQYMFYISAFGIAYSMFQIPFAIYYLKTRKRLIDIHVFILVDFYGDKVISFLLGTGVGAAFGATKDLKKYTIDPDSKSNQFFDMNYIAAIFMFVGSLACFTSSILSSFRLLKEK